MDKISVSELHSLIRLKAMFDDEMEVVYLRHRIRQLGRRGTIMTREKYLVDVFLPILERSVDNMCILESDEPHCTPEAIHFIEKVLKVLRSSKLSHEGRKMFILDLYGNFPIAYLTELDEEISFLLEQDISLYL